MARSINTANFQNAFAQLGQSNARMASLELEERNRRRNERAQLAGVAGGAIGGSFGGPTGAQLGAIAGSKLAGGGVSQASTGTSHTSGGGATNTAGRKSASRRRSTVSGLAQSDH